MSRPILGKVGPSTSGAAIKRLLEAKRLQESSKVIAREVIQDEVTRTGFSVQITGREGDLEAPIIKVLQAVMNSRLTIVRAGTGTGKSIGIPPALIESDPTTYSRIFICVPTINAALSLYNSQLLYTQGKYKIGYAADRVINYEKDTQIIYATSGHIYLRMLSDTLGRADIIILDEYQKASIEAAMILRFWMHSKEKTKMLIMSANVINIDTPDPKNKPTLVDISIASPYKVEVVYSKTDRNDRNLHNKTLYKDTANEVIKYANNPEVADGAFLVFCAGQSEINQLRSNILSSKDANKFNIIEIVGGVKISDIDQKVPGKRNLILATNAVETAVTIPNLVAVFDTMREKVPFRNDTGNMSIRLSWTTKDNAEQRKGRIGRTAPGYLVRMCTYSRYNQLVQSNTSPFLTNSIDRVYLQLLDYNKDVGMLNELHYPEDVSKQVNKTIIASKRQLLKYKLIDVNDTITEAGKYASNSYLSSRFASFLYFWYYNNYNPFTGIILASIMDTVSVGIYQADSGKRVDNLGKLAEALRIFNGYYGEIRMTNHSRLVDNQNINSFALKNHIMPKFISSALTLANNLCIEFTREEELSAGYISVDVLNLIGPVLSEAGFREKDNIYTLIEDKLTLEITNEPVGEETIGPDFIEV